MTQPGPLRRILALPTRSLRARMLVSFAGLAAVVLGAVTVVVVTAQRRSLKENAWTRLENVAAVTEGEINRWVDGQADHVVMLAGFDETRAAAARVRRGTDSTGVALAQLQEVVERGAAGSDTREMFVLSTAGGRVVASSDPSHVGVFHLEDVFYEEGKHGLHVQNVYTSSFTLRPTLTVSAPIVAPDGEVVAVLAANLNLDRMVSILGETSTLGSTAEAYPVSPSYDIISSERFGAPGFERGIHTDAVEHVLQGETGTGEYRTYDGRMVLGAYRWLPERQLGLIVEMDRDEALALVDASVLGILGVGTLATLVLLGGVGRIGRRVGMSLESVSQGADQVAQGAFDVELEVRGDDEVAHLTTAFNSMTARLRGLYGDLQGQIDVNERTLLALEESRGLLEAIIQNSSAFIAVYGPDAGVILTNRALEQALGVPPDALIGRQLTDALPEADARIHTRARDVALRENRTVDGDLHMTVGAEDRTLHAVWFPLRDHRGVPYSVGFIATDISERARAEEERKRYEAQLRHAQKLESLGVLAGGIAHDFNNILAAVLGHADLARDTAVDLGEAEYHLRQVVMAAERAAQLTNQMLAYAGRASVQTETIDLNKVVQEVWSLLSVSMDKKIRLEQDLADQPCRVRADPSQISQVVMNLVTNAGQAIGEGSGTVTVRTSADVRLAVATEGVRPGHHVRLAVSDTGCGMDEATLERIFDPFFTTKESGRGLGLAAVIGIVKGLGGDVRVDSAPGRGTTFEILLPQTQDADPPSEALSVSTGDGPSATILLADDEESVRSVARRVLERAGNSVLEAQDGIEALRRYDEEGAFVSAAVLDVSMPGLGGREVFEELRKRDPTLPVLFITGYDPADAVRGLDDRGRVRYLQKPYRPATLIKLLTELLEEDPNAHPGGG